MMVLVFVSFRPNGNPMVKQLRIGLGAAVNLNATVT